jgi:hypothetical protein
MLKKNESKREGGSRSRIRIEVGADSTLLVLVVAWN